MTMKADMDDVSKVATELKQRSRKDGKRFTLFFSEKAYKDFKKLCDTLEVSPSKVIETWMIQAVVDSKGKK